MINQKKKNIIFFAAAGLLIVVSIVFFIHSYLPTGETGKNPGYHENENENPEDKTNDPGGIDYEAYYNENEQYRSYFATESIGEIYDVHVKNDITIFETQFGPFPFHLQYPSNTLVWVKKEGETFSHQFLNDRTHLIHVTKEHGEIFWKVDESLDFIIYYEHSSGEDLTGYVLSVNENEEKIETIYQTKGSFEDVYRTTSGDIVIVEKITIDPKNEYPNELKPSEKHHYRFNGETFEFYKKSD